MTQTQAHFFFFLLPIFLILLDTETACQTIFPFFLFPFVLSHACNVEKYVNRYSPIETRLSQYAYHEVREQTVRFSLPRKIHRLSSASFRPAPRGFLHFLALQLLPAAEFSRDWFLKKPAGEQEKIERETMYFRVARTTTSFTSCVMHTRAVSLDNVARYLYCGKDIKAWASQFAFLPFFSGSTLQNEDTLRFSRLQKHT